MTLGRIPDDALVVLVAGAGAREHALALKIGESAQVSRVIAAPGNPGFRLNWVSRAPLELWPCELGSPGGLDALAERARGAGVSLAVIGPDDALALGAVDRFERAGIPAFGPKADAARIESSKLFAKSVMRAAGIPTADYREAESLEEAEKAIDSTDWPGWVVKADGLALGKGVRVCSTRDEAKTAARELLGISGRLVIEEKLDGSELSWFAFCDGERAALLDPARDYKRLEDGDRGPNTGGMGAVSPVPGLNPQLEDFVRDRVFAPVLAELRARRAPFRGLLYAGLMVQGERAKVLEFNARFGDPETQALLPRMRGDLVEWLIACAQGDLARLPARVPFLSVNSAYVVAAARGYPDAPEKGATISVVGDLSKLRFAGVAGEPLRVSGGRVLGALGTGESAAEARARAYEALGGVRFDGMRYRADIGAEPDPSPRHAANGGSEIPIAVLASGRGSNLEAILRAIDLGKLRARVVGVVSDRPGARALEIARARGIPAECIEPRREGQAPIQAASARIPLSARTPAGPTTAANSIRAEHEDRIRDWLRPLAPDAIVLAGYLRLLTRGFIDSFRAPDGGSRVVNIHPSLLPAFPGLNAYRQAFLAGVKVTGVTIHLVEEELDAGPILAQEAFSIDDCRASEEIEARGLALEHRLYPATIERWLSGGFRSGDRGGSRVYLAY